MFTVAHDKFIKIHTCTEDFSHDLIQAEVGWYEDLLIHHADTTMLFINTWWDFMSQVLDLKTNFTAIKIYVFDF